MMKGLFRRRQGYTLVELVLAIAITALIASTASTLISYALRMRTMSDAQTDMYLVSIRLHKAITTELTSTGNVCLYTKGPSTYTTVPVTERVLYLDSNVKSKTYGQVLLGNKSAASAKLLPMDGYFDSYDDVVVESLTFKVASVLDYVNADTSTPTELYRCVKVTTVVSKGAWRYEHTTAIRFDEMILYSSQVKVSTDTNTFVPTSSNIRDARAGDTGTEFKLLRYTLE